MDNPLRTKELAREIKNIAFSKGVDFVGFADKEAFKKFSVNLEDYLPRAKTAICLGIKYPENVVKGESMYSGAVNFKLEMAEFAVAKYLEKLGYAALTEVAFEPGSAMERNAFGPGGKSNFYPTQAALASGMKEKNKNWQFMVILTDTKIEPTSSLNRRDKKEVTPQKKITNLTEVVKRESLKKGADLVGITGIERLNKIADSLQSIVEDKNYFIAVDEGWPVGKAIVKVIPSPLKIKRPSSYLPDAKSVIVLGLHYPNAALDNAISSPGENVAPAAFQQRGCLNQLSLIGWEVVLLLSALGYKSFSTWDLFGISSFIRDNRPFWGGGDNLYPDATANSYVAIAAGLGEIGLHGIALTPEYGARQRFLSIITDAPLEQNSLYQGRPLCQKCKKCIQACPVSALHPEKRVLIEIEGKTFESASLNRLRCDWAKRYGLVGEAGPKYFGSKTNFAPPKKITPEKLAEALKKRDLIQKERISIVERCLKVCPAHLVNDKKGLKDI